MATCFLDSSALVKRVVRETGSAWVEGLFTPAQAHDIFVVSIARVEVVAAITRRARAGSLSPDDASAACAQFEADLAADCQTVDVTETLITLAVTLARTHGLRGYDAIQLAAAVQINRMCLASGLPPLVFVSADIELNAAAVRAGLSVDNPNSHP